MGINSFGGSATYTAAQHGLVGVVDGVTRDAGEMRAVGLPVARRVASACRRRELFPCPTPLFTA
jgi:regulator of RNase E activity RraA